MLGMSLTRFPSDYRLMHEHKSKCDSFGDFMGQKYGQGSTCLPQTAAGPVLRSLDLAAAPRTADRLSHQTRTYNKQVQTIRNSTPGNINSTKRCY